MVVVVVVVLLVYIHTYKHTYIHAIHTYVGAQKPGRPRYVASYHLPACLPAILSTGPLYMPLPPRVDAPLALLCLAAYMLAYAGAQSERYIRIPFETPSCIVRIGC